MRNIQSRVMYADSNLLIGGSPTILSLFWGRLSLQRIAMSVVGTAALLGIVYVTSAHTPPNTSVMVDTPQNVSQAKVNVQSTESEGGPAVSNTPVSQSQNSSQSTVVVNGQTITAPTNGSVHRTITQNGQKTQVDMENHSTQSSTSTSASSSSSSSVYVNSNSNQSQTSITHTQTVP